MARGLKGGGTGGKVEGKRRKGGKGDTKACLECLAPGHVMRGIATGHSAAGSRGRLGHGRSRRKPQHHRIRALPCACGAASCAEAGRGRLNSKGRGERRSARRFVLHAASRRVAVATGCSPRRGRGAASAPRTRATPRAEQPCGPRIRAPTRAARIGAEAMRKRCGGRIVGDVAGGCRPESEPTNRTLVGIRPPSRPQVNLRRRRRRTSL